MTAFVCWMKFWSNHALTGIVFAQHGNDYVWNGSRRTLCNGVQNSYMVLHWLVSASKENNRLGGVCENVFVSGIRGFARLQISVHYNNPTLSSLCHRLDQCHLMVDSWKKELSELNLENVQPQIDKLSAELQEIMKKINTIELDAQSIQGECDSRNREIKGGWWLSILIDMLLYMENISFSEMTWAIGDVSILGMNEFKIFATRLHPNLIQFSRMLESHSGHDHKSKIYNLAISK